MLLPLQKQTGLLLNNHTELFPNINIINRIDIFLKKNHLLHKKYIAIGPSASYPLKRWPLEYFNKLIGNVKELKVSAEKLFSDDAQDKTVKKVKKKNPSSKTKAKIKK